MAADRAVSILGLGFGDCGKGRAVDAAVRRFQAHTVVRVNGGAQAGHNVVAEDGRHHTFSQFGAGTFSPEVHTLLAAPVVVHPTALAEEAAALGRVGIGDALERLHVDPRCVVTTPFHQAVGRLRELGRGAAAHGSCGVGFGETVAHSLRHPDEVLRWRDLANPVAASDRLRAIRATSQREVDELDGSADVTKRPAALREIRMLEDDGVADRWLERATAVWHRAGGSRAGIADRLERPGTIVIEGAQGVLLDEDRGFHPHTTWSRVHSDAAESVFEPFARPAEILHFGVIRCYHTRHGAGPLPTEDASLAPLDEPHNGDGGWQGPFRRGHFDALLFAYALRSIGRMHGLIVTHLDAFDGPVELRWCDGYRVEPAAGEASTGSARIIERLPEDGPSPSSALTRLLSRVVPRYDASGPRDAARFVERLEKEFAIPVVATSSGTSAQSFVWRRAGW